MSAERIKKNPENHVTLQCPEADESQDVTCTDSTNADLKPTMADNPYMSNIDDLIRMEKLYF